MPAQLAVLRRGGCRPRGNRASRVSLFVPAALRREAQLLTTPDALREVRSLSGHLSRKSQHTQAMPRLIRP